MALFEPFPVLESGPLLLRQIKPRDQIAVFQGLSEPKVIRYYGVEYHSLVDTKAQMEWYEENLHQGSGIWWAITRKEVGDLIGTCGLYNLQPQHRKAELGYWLMPHYWGQGFMQASLQAVLAYGQQQLNLHRIEAFVETKNVASGKLLRKLGFEQEGVLRDAEIKQGRFISLEVYALLQPPG